MNGASGPEADLPPAAQRILADHDRRRRDEVLPPLPPLVRDRAGQWWEARPAEADGRLRVGPPAWWGAATAEEELSLRRLIAAGGAWLIDGDAVDADAPAARMLGLAVGRQPLARWHAGIHPADLGLFMNVCGRLASGAAGLLDLQLRMRPAADAPWRFHRLRGRRWSGSIIAGSVAEIAPPPGPAAPAGRHDRFRFESDRGFALVLDGDGRVADLSDGAASVLGISRSAWIGIDGVQLAHPDDRPAMAAALRRARGDGGADPFEARMRHRDGRWLWMEASARMIEDAQAGAWLSVACWLIDGRKRAADEMSARRDDLDRRIAERDADLQEAKDQIRRREEQLARSASLRALGALVAGIVHEVSAPLAAVDLGLAAAQHARQPAAGEAIAKARSALRRAVGIIDQLRDVARDRPTATFLDADLGELAETALGLVEHASRRPGIRIERDFGRGARVFVSPSRLVQALVNLLLNAVQALPERGGAIRIQVRIRPDGQRELTVADDGRGMPDDVIRRLGEPFFTTRGDAGGMGLGVAVTMGIVRESNGTLEYRSSPGRGTTAILTLPGPAKP